MDAPDFRALFEAAPGCYLVLAPDFTIVGVNDAYLRATMTRREEIVGRGLFTVFPDNPGDPGATGTKNLRASLERVLAKRAPDPMPIQKYDIRRPDGTFEERFWKPVNAPVLAGGRVAWILHSVADVTEQQGNEERFRLLVESARDYALLMLDPEGRVVSWNAGTQRLKGWTADEVVGKYFSVFYPEEDVARGKPEAELREAVERGRVEDEGWRVRKDGSRFFANVVITAIRDANGKLRGFSKVTRDMTERKAAEARIRELSTPILELEEGLLLLPLVGAIDETRADQMTNQLLRAIRAHRARAVVMDVTGVATIDSGVANHLLQTIQAARLLGARCVVTGVSAEIAQTLVRIGVEGSQLNAAGDLHEGIMAAREIVAAS